jgi:2-oxoglutarate decarboxylase
MLRMKAATSAPEELTHGQFRPVIGDESAEASHVDRVILCAGKIYYDLVGERESRGDERTAIVRVEQLAPLPVDEILAELARYPHAAVVWAQQEPANMGPWPHVALHLPEHLGGRPLHRASRPASASPASGSSKRHEQEHRELLARALGR